MPEATQVELGAATAENIEVQEGQPIIHEAPQLMSDASPEEVAKAAYAKVAEELKWKGDFLVWEAISDRAKELLIEGAAHVQTGGEPRTSFEEAVVEVLI